MSANLSSGGIQVWVDPITCCDPVWEEAYKRFETEAQELEKFNRRLKHLGVDRFDRQDRVVELFCGRGNGLKALEAFGFRSLEGVDLSLDLLNEYDGPAQLYVGDCRQLKFDDDSKDLVIVQGGLHHLPTLPGDLERALDEVKRVLSPGGRFILVEPWMTPFLFAVHFAMQVPGVRRLSAKVDALAVMTEREHTTYFQWLGKADEILSLLNRRFTASHQEKSFGKLYYVGVKSNSANRA